MPRPCDGCKGPDVTDVRLKNLEAFMDDVKKIGIKVVGALIFLLLVALGNLAGIIYVATVAAK